MDNVIHVWGYPEIIISDRGGHFISDLQESLYKELAIKRIKTTAYNPATSDLMAQ